MSSSNRDNDEKASNVECETDDMAKLIKQRVVQSTDFENGVLEDQEGVVRMRIEGAGQGADLDCTCQAVKGDGNSVVYECSYEVKGNDRQLGSSAVRGKFAMNVPYV